MARSFPLLLFVFLTFALPFASAQRSLTSDRGCDIGIIPTPQHVVMHPGHLPTSLIRNTMEIFRCDEVPYQEWFAPSQPKHKRHSLLRYQKNSSRLCHFSPSVVVVDSIVGAINQSEAYCIDISPSTLICYVTSPQSLENALRTLASLAVRWDTIPAMTLTDYPALLHRVWQDDISRGPVCNMPYMAQLAAFLKSMKLYTASFYTEHTLFNSFYNDIADRQNSVADAALVFPVDEVDAHPHFINNLQCFGHFEKTLRIPYYSHLKDSPYNINPSSAEALRLLASQIAVAKRTFPHAPYFNINCDETEALGSGRARSWVDSMGSDEAYCYHINQVYRLVKDSSNEVMMWGDIVAKNPSMIALLPRDMNFICWNYSPSTDFSVALRPFVEAKAAFGNPFWVAPSTSHFGVIHSSCGNYIKNIAFLARDGFRFGATGMLITTWDDSGLELIQDSPHALAWAAEMAWNPIRDTNATCAIAELAAREAAFNENYNFYLSHNYYASVNPIETPWLLSDGSMGQDSLPTDTPLWHYSDSSLTSDQWATDLIYAVGDLSSNSFVDDWFKMSGLQQPLLSFFPTAVDTSARLRADSVWSLTAGLCRRFKLPTLAQLTYPEPQAITPVFKYPTAAVYALHRLQATAYKARLRCHLFEAFNSHAAAVTSLCRFEMDTLLSLLHTLKREYLNLWDYENGSYGRDFVCRHFDDMATEILEADRHVFVTTTRVNGLSWVSLHTLFDNRPIYYSLDGRQPSASTTRYEVPFVIDRSCEVKAVTYNEWDEPVFSNHYTLCHKALDALRHLHSDYSTYREAYSGGGANALVDGRLGGDDNYADGHWQGYWGSDIDVELDMGCVTTVNTLTLRFFQHTFDWILVPRNIRVYASDNGTVWHLVRDQCFTPDFRRTQPHVEVYSVQKLSLATRYLRVVVPNPGPLPDFHQAHGQPSYLFVDEVVVE